VVEYPTTTTEIDCPAQEKYALLIETYDIRELEVLCAFIGEGIEALFDREGESTCGVVFLHRELHGSRDGETWVKHYILPT
jgi:hypothetical protein